MYAEKLKQFENVENLGGKAWGLMSVKNQVLLQNVWIYLLSHKVKHSLLAQWEKRFVKDTQKITDKRILLEIQQVLLDAQKIESLINTLKLALKLDTGENQPCYK